MTVSEPIPEGFELLPRSSPFTDLIGPIYSQQRDQNMILAIRGADKHCNGRGFIHGGILCTLADIAMGYNCALASTSSKGLVTSNLTIDFANSIRPGDWIEVRVDVQKVGRTLAFANCYCWVGDKRVARASGVFRAHSHS